MQGARIAGFVRGQGFAGTLAGGHEADLEAWVRGKQPDQLAADMAARADDADADRVHARRSCNW